MHPLKRPDSNKFKFLSWKKPWSEINRLKGKCNSHHSIPSLPMEHQARNFLSWLLNQTKFPQCTHTQSQSPDTSRRIYSITKSPPLLQHKWHHLGTQPHLLRAPSSLLSRSDRSNKEPGLCNNEEKSIAAKSFPDKLIFSWECDYRRIEDCSKKWAQQILVELTNLHLWFILNLYLVIPREGERRLWALAGVARGGSHAAEPKPLCCTSGLRTGVQLYSFLLLLLLETLENWLVGNKNDGWFIDDTCASCPRQGAGTRRALRSLPAQSSLRFSCKKTLFLGKNHTKDVLALRPQSPLPPDGTSVAMADALSRSRAVCAVPRDR